MHFSQKLQWVLLLQDCFNIQNVITCSCQKYCFWQESFWRLSKRKRKILHAHLLSYFLCFSHDLLHFVMLLLTQSAPKTRILKFYNSFPTFWGKKWNLLFICHYSLLLFTVTIHLLLFMTLFTPKFCLFKGGCPLYFKQVFSVLSSWLLS